MPYLYKLSDFYIQYLCDNIGEAVIEHRSYNNSIPQSIDTVDLGKMLCDILNSEETLKDIRNKSIINLKKSKIDTKEQAWLKLKDIYYNVKHSIPCLEITHKYITDTLSSVKFEPKQYCINSTNKYFDKVINTIKWAKNYTFNNNYNSTFELPAMTIMDISTDTPTLTRTMRSYNIHSLDELLRTMLYEIQNSKYHLKQCKYENCNKYFIAKYGQERYCTNPCPDNPNKTCRDVRYYLKINDDNPEKIEKGPEWFEIINEKIIPKKKKITSMYIYYINHPKGKKYNYNSKDIQKEKNIFLNECKNLKRIIKANADKENWKYYYDIYKKFLNDVSQNLKSSPKIFKIERPEYQ